ncbi:MAG: UvrD-helicase domain-containing protein, partial [Oscillospiraceae bacterium]|nr:UvrD-helicase domain-containing protein [Oscillospiraceae bacterium]
MAWTEQQQAAIDARGASLVVSAAAGSGKTSVLVTRITELLADPSEAYPAEKTVVVTFTNDAAAEVRTRLNTV